MLGRDKQYKDVKDYLSDVSRELIVAVLDELGFVCTRKQAEPLAPDDVLVTCSAQFVGSSGRALMGVRINVVPVVSNYTITSPSTNELFYPSLSSVSHTYETDGSGLVEFKLFKGATVRVYSELNASVREIVVPETDFNLFDHGIETSAEFFSDIEVAKDLLIKRDV